MTPILNKLRGFGRDEDGGGTIFGLYIFCIMLMIFGLAIDVANAWRNRTFLTSTADIAAHAAAVGIANGESQSQIRSDIDTIIKTNLPTVMFGTMIDTSTDVSFGEYDVHKYGWSSIGGADYNGAVVKLERSKDYGNPVTTFIMRLMGVTSFDLSARSAAVYDINGACDSSNGVYSEGKVTITTQGDIGSGYCLHSNDIVWLPQNNVFADDTMVTMAHFSQCGSKCTDAANPGIRARPGHSVFPDIGQYILDAYDDLIQTGIPSSGYKHDWFTKVTDTTAADYNANDPEITLGDTTTLVPAVALLTATPSLGDVVEISKTEFEAFTDPLPSGLVYHVDCSGLNGKGKTTLTFDSTHGVMDGGVLLTDCSLYFDAGSSVVKSVIITTSTNSSGAIGAAEGTTMGDQSTNDCHSNERSAIMSMGDVTVPADFTLSNLTMIVDGNVNVAAISAASKSGTNKVSYGFALYTSGNASFASKQTFRQCAGATDQFAPETKILRIVVPPKLLSDGSLQTGVYQGDSTVNPGEILLEAVTPGMDLTNSTVTVSDSGSSTTTTTTTTTTDPSLPAY